MRRVALIITVVVVADPLLPARAEALACDNVGQILRISAAPPGSLSCPSARAVLLRWALTDFQPPAGPRGYGCRVVAATRRWSRHSCRTRTSVLLFTRRLRAG